MSATETSQVNSSVPGFDCMFKEAVARTYNRTWYKGLTFKQKLQHHIYLSQRTDLSYNVRRGHRDRVMSMISKLAKRLDQSIDSVLFSFKISRADLKVSKNK